MQKLIDGVKNFKTKVHDKNQEIFEELSKGQSPEALFITCSDSRVDPNLLTQTKPGELFVLRNAGNIVPPHGSSNGGEEATIEYAVAVLNVKDIIICGHSDCGAMKGLLRPDQIKEFPNVIKWLTHAEATWRIVMENYPNNDGNGRTLSNAIEENVLVQLDNLRTIPVVSARVARGALNLHAWVYDIKEGEIYSYSSEQRRFVPLTGSVGDSYMNNAINKDNAVNQAAV